MELYDGRGQLLNINSAREQRLAETVEYQAGDLEMLKERLAELELQMEDQGWRQLIVGGQREFSHGALIEIIRMSRLMYLKNPLIRRGVDIQALYVWGRGVTIQARDPKVNEVVQAFLDDKRNQAELTSHVARKGKEIALQVMGNIFFVLFTNPSTGEVKVRTVPVDTIRQIVSNPDDAKEPWFYRREWEQIKFNEANGQQESTAEVAYYPDWSYNPKNKPATLYGAAVKWDQPIYHLKVGALDDMSMGVPETYPGLDWAKAYKELLEDYCTIKRAHARFALKFETKGGARGVAAAKAKLATTLANGTNQTTTETNPSPNVASTFIGTEGTKLEVMKTAGASSPPEEGRRVLLMAAAASGWAETFYGDASVGTLATAKSLDRPTELKVKDRQTLWAEALRQILDFVIDRAMTATSGPLYGMGVAKNAAAADVVTLKGDPKSGEEIDRYVDIAFPSVLEHDVKEMIDSIVQAATLGNTQGQLAGTIDLKNLSKMLFTELGTLDPSQIDEMLDELFPEGEEVPSGKPLPDSVRLAKAQADPNAPVANPDHPDPNDSPQPSLDDDLARSATSTESQRLMVEAVTELREALKSLATKYAPRAA